MTHVHQNTATLRLAIEDALRVAGEYLLARTPLDPIPNMAVFREEFAVMDAEVVAILRPALMALRPDAAWIDELDAEGTPEGAAWLVDPVDGAVQYMRGLPQWCISATLLSEGEPVLTVLHNPLLGETYSAARGEGAWRNGERISPSITETIDVALVATSQPPFAAQNPAAVALAGASLSRVLESVGAVRNLGPTSWQVADVAAGRLDAFWEFGEDRSNLLGSTLIAREAGACVIDPAGQPWSVNSSAVLVSTPGLHDQLAAVLRPLVEPVK